MDFMDKQKAKQSLMKALFIVSMQIIYVKLFGYKNILVGMIMGMGTVSFLMRDLTGNLVYRGITFLILNIILGIFSFLSPINMWIGFFINFLTIFLTTYVYMNDFRSPTSYIFLMSYIFMWAIPVSLKELPARLVALNFSIVPIILAQLIFNKHRFENDSKKIIEEIIIDINKQIDDITNNTFEISENLKINKKIRNLLVLISEKSSNKFQNSKYEMKQFNIAVYLDRINLIIGHVAKNKKDKKFKDEYLSDIKVQINNISLYNEDYSYIETINKNIDEFIKKYESISDKPIFISDSIHLLKVLKININNKEECKERNIYKIYKTVNVAHKFELIISMKENFNLNSLKMIYSLKLALSISLAMFLIQFLNIPYGRWIVITIYVIMQPYEEDTVIKAKKRLKGTFIGVILFFSIFSLIHDTIPKMIVLFIAFFYYFYFKEYDKKVMCMTTISLSSVSLVHYINIISIGRLMFIAIGVGFGLLINKYFLPYNITDSIEELKLKYKNNERKIQKELDKVLKGKGNLDKLIKLTLEESQIENKLIANNSRAKDEELEKIIYKHSIMMSDARFLLLRFYHEKYILDNV
ncbi:Fusaric acid resistance protein-like [Romboutsia lituseburensis DSM 797]|uniref:Fusaric acid resistance protein-like n=2 Tax=Romboutsia lituseburensis TaxID=1537 RepID=A0A1G9IXH5_9FIRM|nr:Fusaric acid resistance protein-like [Romboutsia lituseburensis DSM 797]